MSGGDCGGRGRHRYVFFVRETLTLKSSILKYKFSFLPHTFLIVVVRRSCSNIAVTIIHGLNSHNLSDGLSSDPRKGTNKLV